MQAGDKIVSAVTQGGAKIAGAIGEVALSAELELTLLKATKDAEAIATASKSIPHEVGRLVAEIAIIAQGIIETVRKDPRDYKVIRSFFDYNLGKSREVVEHRVNVVETADQEVIKGIDKVLESIKDSFKEMQGKCFENDHLGAEVSAETLSRVMKQHI